MYVMLVNGAWILQSNDFFLNHLQRSNISLVLVLILIFLAKFRYNRIDPRLHSRVSGWLNQSLRVFFFPWGNQCQQMNHNTISKKSDLWFSSKIQPFSGMLLSISRLIELTRLFPFLTSQLKTAFPRFIVCFESYSTIKQFSPHLILYRSAVLRCT